MAYGRQHTRRRMMISKGLLALLVLSWVETSIAQSRRDDLLGSWRFLKGSGGPCRTEIRDLHYFFHSDGKYSANAVMANGTTLRYQGTFSATDRDVTAVVEGQTIGPIPYRIVGDVLIVRQSEFGCDVELIRDDE